jgi:hypothetical protein
MAGSPYATTDDVASRWPSYDASMSTVATALLGDASLLMRAAVTGLDDRIAADSSGTLGALATMVCANMTIRALRNPDGVTQQSTTTGSYTDMQSYSSATASGVLAMTPDELALLSPVPSDVASLGVGTARLGAGLGYGRDGIWRHRDEIGRRRRVVRW